MKDENLFVLVRHLESVRAKERILKEKASKIQGRIVKELTRRDETSLELPESADGIVLRATLVQPERMTWDVESLKDLLPPSKFEKVTRVTVDSKAMEDAVKRGEVPTDVVASTCEVSPGTPYMRVAPARPA